MNGRETASTGHNGLHVAVLWSRWEQTDLEKILHNECVLFLSFCSDYFRRFSRPTVPCPYMMPPRGWGEANEPIRFVCWRNSRPEFSDTAAAFSGFQAVCRNEYRFQQGLTFMKHRPSGLSDCHCCLIAWFGWQPNYLLCENWVQQGSSRRKTEPATRNRKLDEGTSRTKIVLIKARLNGATKRAVAGTAPAVMETGCRRSPSTVSTIITFTC